MTRKDSTTFVAVMLFVLAIIVVFGLSVKPRLMPTWLSILISLAVIAIGIGLVVRTRKRDSN